MAASHDPITPDGSFGFREPADGAIAARVDDFARAGIAGRIAAQDPHVWGPDAAAEAARRLGWVTLAQRAEEVVTAAAELRSELLSRGVDRVVLCGMGGSSLAPEVICGTAGVPLTVLDSTDPVQVLEAVSTHPERTAYVVASKSGGTVETDSHRRLIESTLRGAGLDPADHLVVITDEGSPLHELARTAGYRTFLGDANVGGRFSALSAFGLVPSALAGADVARLVADALAIAPKLAADTRENPALWLAAALDLAQAAGGEKLIVLDDDAVLPGFGAWLEQLVAESTGKEGTGVLPIAIDKDAAAGVRAHGTPYDVLTTLYDVSPAPFDRHDLLDARQFAIFGQAPLGALFLIWEHATAVLGHALGINPFNQPDVESAKAGARALLADEVGASGFAADIAEPGIAAAGSTGDAASVADALATFLAGVADDGYIALQAFVDRTAQPSLLDDLRSAVELTAHVPTSLGYGPRYLHSTGQYHKGGKPNGWFLQITADSPADVPVPGQDFTLQQLITAQAAGDAGVLAERGRPVLRLHLDDLESGLERLLELLETEAGTLSRR